MKQLSLHVTDSCNSKCGFCVVGSPLAQRDSVNYNDLVAFLIENANQGYESVNFHGGEPTIHPRLFDLLEIVKTLGYPEVQIQTNGRKLKNFEFTKRLSESNVRLLVISLHGFRPETQDLLAQVNGGFVETIEGIRHAKNLGIKVRTNTVLTMQNIDELNDLASLCINLNVDHINISNLHPVGSGYFAIDSMSPGAEDIRRKLLPVVKRLMDANARITLEGFPLCTVVPYEDISIELDRREIRMMYQGAVYDNYDQFMDSQCRTYGPPCQECSLKGKCGGVYKEYAERRGWTEFADPATVASR